MYNSFKFKTIMALNINHNRTSIMTTYKFNLVLNISLNSKHTKL